VPVLISDCPAAARQSRNGAVRSATGIVALIALGLLGFAHAVSVTPDELAAARRWAAAKWEALPPGEPLEPARVPLPPHGPVRNQDPPFSFVYGGRPSADLLRGWELKTEVTDRLPGNPKRTQMGPWAMLR